jgi:hypothetical protein
MFAILPLLGGLLLGRFTTVRVAVTTQCVFFAIAAAVLVATAPDHGASHLDGLWLSLVLAPLSALTVFLGRIWRRRTLNADVQPE